MIMKESASRKANNPFEYCNHKQDCINQQRFNMYNV